MNYSLRLLGLALLLVSAWLVGAGYAAYCKRRLRVISAFVSLISHIEKRVTLFLSTQSDLLSGYENSDISEFVEQARFGKGLYEAFLAVSGKLPISEEIKKSLSDFFSDFGKSYKDRELKRISMFLDELTEEQKLEEEKTPARIKLAYTLLFAAAGSLVIILL